MAESFEVPEKPGSNSERIVGLIIAIIAVVLAIVSSVAHRSQSEEIVKNVQSSDKYSFYEARKGRELQYELAIDNLEGSSNPKADELKAKYQAKIDREKSESEHTVAEAKALENDATATAGRSFILDCGEIVLQVAIVLCSITIITEIMIFVRCGVVLAVLGALTAIYGTFFAG